MFLFARRSLWCTFKKCLSSWLIFGNGAGNQRTSASSSLSQHQVALSSAVTGLAHPSAEKSVTSIRPIAHLEGCPHSHLLVKLHSHRDDSYRYVRGATQ